MEDREKSLLIGLLSPSFDVAKPLGEFLGKPGTKSDLQFYNRLDAHLNCAITTITAVSYPEKLKPLLQVAALTKVHIMLIDAEKGITPEVGEIMVLMDIYKKYFNSIPLCAISNITPANEWKVEEIRASLVKILKNTTLNDIPIFLLKEKGDFDKLKEFLGNKILPSISYDLNPESSPVKVLIDHAFPVKGVGTVVLGLVTRGIVKAGEMYDIIPVHKKVILRSIQSHDRDIKEAYPGVRVGLALKGVKHDVIDRNVIFCSLGTFKTSEKARIELEVFPYYKPQSPQGVISPSDAKVYHLSSNLGITPIKLLEGDSIPPGKKGILSVKLERPLPYDEEGLRGLIVDLGPFENKLRIVGYYHQIDQ